MQYTSVLFHIKIIIYYNFIKIDVFIKLLLNICLHRILHIEIEEATLLFIKKKPPSVKLQHFNYSG